MNPCLSVLLGGAAAAIFATIAAAQPATGPGKAPGAHPMDCAKAKDKARCEALNKQIEACRDKIGDEWRECMHQHAPAAKFTPPEARDCSKARNRERCEAHASALGACKDKTTLREHRKCMAMQLPAPAPATAQTPKKS